jgi:hypothetical protein
MSNFTVPTEDQLTNIERYPLLLEIVKSEVMGNLSGTEQAIADKAELDALVVPFKEAIAAYKALDGYTKQCAMEGKPDIQAQEARGVIIARFNLSHTNINELLEN